MSYDLYFMQKQESESTSRVEIKEYFSKRKNYKIINDQYWYQNDDTGVYFSFEHTEDNRSEEFDSFETFSKDEFKTINFLFNLNYLRSGFFAIEALMELNAFIRNFSLIVDDPQIGGMGRGEFKKDAFIQGWYKGNYLAYKSIIETDLQNRKNDSLPSASLVEMWRWNYGRKKLQSTLGSDIFVPVINLMRHKNRPQRWAVWADGIPQAIPKVDMLMLVRKELAPKRLFKTKQDFCLIPFSSIMNLLDLAEQHAGFYEKRPKRIVEFFQSQKPCDQVNDGLPWDEVLETEAFEQSIMYDDVLQ
jgi:hypothetical protein